MVSLGSRIVDLLFKPSKKEKEGSSKKSILLSIGAKGKSCTLHWIPVPVDIERNEMTKNPLRMNPERLRL
ncbi:hypothetical protein TNCV_4760371 [Trichonephila clavipes]|uniref:Uncharacterized protein n=1 Tax=Trichonephila clavipes TaxID=2585209 RepID=A0A8X6RDT5_TRICX|nr:hypothetical protein TNCV_4760371 [Trichonephila clavipes]